MKDKCNTGETKYMDTAGKSITREEYERISGIETDKPAEKTSDAAAPVDAPASGKGGKKA